jgi:hypothetical protein
VRLLARWSAACHAAFRACLLATDTVSNTGLTAPLKGGVTTSTRPFGDRPRMAFLHFRALCALPRKGCYV